MAKSNHRERGQYKIQDKGPTSTKTEMSLLLIPCKEMNVEHDSTLKTSTSDKDCPEIIYNNIPSVFLESSLGEDKIYAVHTTTSDKVERLFSIDLRLGTNNSITNRKYKKTIQTLDNKRNKTATR